MAKDNSKDGQVEQVYIDIAKSMRDAELNFLPRVYKKLFTIEEANIVRELPASFEDVAKKLGLSKENVEKVCRKLVKEGKILQTDRGPKAFSFGSQFGDIFLGNCEMDVIRDQEFTELLGGYLMSPERLKNEKYYLSEGLQVNGQPINRVLPNWKAIKDIPGVMPCEDVREALNAYKDTLNTTRCCCRTGTEGAIPDCSMKEGRGTVPEDGTCIHFGKMAQYFTEIMEITPYRSVDEILKVVDRLDQKKHYQMVPNDRDVKWICNCCTCHCQVAGAFINDPMLKLSEMLAKSRFLSTVKSENCTGCEACAEICPFAAIEMRDGKAYIDAEKCYGCGQCVVNCPAEAMKMKIVRPAEHIPEGGAQLVDGEILEVREIR
jgi:Fe-S-cluster-containing hydrogenase component 2